MRDDKNDDCLEYEMKDDKKMTVRGLRFKIEGGEKASKSQPMLITQIRTGR
jgi:hypothetical protein